MDGFWLPQLVSQSVLAVDTPWAHLTLRHGQPAQADDPAAVTVRWPQLSLAQWQRLLAELQDNRRRLPHGPALWRRLQQALTRVGRRLADPQDPLHRQVLAALPAYTGYSQPMIQFALRAMELMALDQLPQALNLTFDRRGVESWQPLGDLPGCWRFYPARQGWWDLRRLAGDRAGPLFAPVSAPGLVIGYGAGNVPGTALLIAFLGLATALVGDSPPAIVVKNSRQEPIFAALVLAALEAEDPEVVSSSAVLIWDYEDADLQRRLLAQAGLVVAAASDATIAQIQAALAGATAERRSGQPRLHAHGHKVSFSAVGREVLRREAVLDGFGAPLLEVVAHLAALDSVFWDQNGCLSSRIHFVELGGQECYGLDDYAAALTGQLRRLAEALPRGAWPRHQLHDRFDRYKLLEGSGLVQVLSDYDDPFVVIVDRRPVSKANGAALMRSTVNDCQGRVVIVRPVADLQEAPDHYLALLPPANLQSLSVAVGQPGQRLTERFLRFASACGQRGVTAIRTVGRGAFPQLAYSWDGLVPLDLVATRPPGHFTTIEFDMPYEQMLETFRVLSVQ